MALAARLWLAPGVAPERVGNLREGRIPWDDKGDAFVKAEPLHLAKRLARHLRPETLRSYGAFVAASRLERAGVPTAAPLACLVDGDRAFFVARFVPGERLDAALARALAARDAEATRSLAIQAAELAARIHVAGVAHGDLKPPNIIVAAEGLVAIDLDQARLAVTLRARAKDLAALDAYGQRGPRVPRRIRLEAFRAYAAIAHPEGALFRRVVARSLWKRARWARA